MRLPTRSKLIFHSLLGGAFITALAIALRPYGFHQTVLYLAYPGIYLMQSILQDFLEWLPFAIGLNAIAEALLFFLANSISYAIPIFLVLRIFLPDRSENLPPLLNQK